MLFCCAQVWADQHFRQDIHFLASVFRDFAILRRIRQNQLFFHCILQRLVQHHMDTLHHAWAESMFSQFRLVFLLHTAAFEQLIVKLLDLQHRQLFQLHTAELRNNVVINRVVVVASIVAMVFFSAVFAQRWGTARTELGGSHSSWTGPWLLATPATAACLASKQTAELSALLVIQLFGIVIPPPYFP